MSTSNKNEIKQEKPGLMFRSTAGQANRFGTNFDSYFTRVMGRGNYGGSAVGECYETASRIVDGDFQSLYQCVGGDCKAGPGDRVGLPQKGT